MSLIATKHSDFKNRQSKRNKAVYFLVGYTIVAIVSLSYAYLIDLALYYFVFTFFAAGLLAWLFIVTTRSWFPEMVETKIFFNFYEAYKQLVRCSGNDERTNEYLKKAHEYTQEAVLKLKNFIISLDKDNSKLIKNELLAPLKEFAKKFETRILPLILQAENSEEMRDLLHDLSLTFIESSKPISKDEIIYWNKFFDGYPPIDVKAPVSRFREFLSTKPVTISLSIIFAFILTVPFLLFYSLWFGDLSEAFSTMAVQLAYLGLLLFVVKEATYPYLKKKLNLFE